MSCFTQPDTIIPNPANPQDLNRYTYVRNNPIKYSDPTGNEVCRTDAIEPVCWSESENIPGVRYEISPGIADWARIAAPANYLSDEPGVWGLPGWTPSAVVDAARENPDLAGELRFLDDALTMPLEDFADLQADAAGNPVWDFSNDGCSDRNAVTGGAAGCIRHDFVYRNQKRIDFEYELGGQLTSNGGRLKLLADRKLDDEVGGIRGLLTFMGVTVGGRSSFYSEWRPRRPGGPLYGASPHVVLPPLDVQPGS